MNVLQEIFYFIIQFWRAFALNVQDHSIIKRTMTKVRAVLAAKMMGV